MILTTTEAIADSTSLAVPIPSDEVSDFPPVGTHESAMSGQEVRVFVVDRSVVPLNRGGQARILLKKRGHTLRWVECFLYPDF